jgi:hypothetical protein
MFLAGPNATTADRLTPTVRAVFHVAPVMMHESRNHMAIVTSASRTLHPDFLTVPNGLVGPPPYDDRNVGASVGDGHLQSAVVAERHRTSSLFPTILTRGCDVKAGMFD